MGLSTFLSSRFQRLFGYNSFYAAMIGGKGEQWVSITGNESEIYNSIPQLKAVVAPRS